MVKRLMPRAHCLFRDMQTWLSAWLLDDHYSCLQLVERMMAFAAHGCIRIQPCCSFMWQLTHLQQMLSLR